VCLDLDVHLGQTWDIYRRVLRDGIRLRFAPGSAGAQVCADPAEIDAALLNLVVNARDVQAEGGRIVIATQRVTAAEAGIGAGGADGFVRICVCDDGPGLPAAMIARLGEPFVTTKPVGCGSGLGLASVMATARRAGGMFRIDSGPQGTTASLFLPIRPGPAEGAAPEAAALPMGRGERVLVVEEDPMVRDVARLRLEALGYQVVEASGAEMALRQVAAGLRVDLVLADVVPAGGDWGRCSGWALVQDLRALRPGLGAVLASGHAGALPGDGWAGAVMLEKPYSLCDLARAVRRGLDPAGQTTGRTTAAKT
jgi:CheY-like chemotaxis protein